jgi:hypothetical protein
VRFSIVLSSAALLASACATGSKSGAEPPVAEVKATGAPGEAIATRTQTLSVTVKAVDAATRSLTVQTPDGETDTFKVGPEVKRFGEIAPGDVIAAEVTQGLLLEFQPPGTESVPPQAVAIGGAAGAGLPPGAAAAAGVQATVTVVAIDPKSRVVTLQGPEGNKRSVKAGPKIQLERLQVGDRLLATYVESIAIAVEKGGSKL